MFAINSEYKKWCSSAQNKAANLQISQKYYGTTKIVKFERKRFTRFRMLNSINKMEMAIYLTSFVISHHSNGPASVNNQHFGFSSLRNLIYVNITVIPAQDLLVSPSYNRWDCLCRCHCDSVTMATIFMNTCINGQPVMFGTHFKIVLGFRSKK